MKSFLLLFFLIFNANSSDFEQLLDLCDHNDSESCLQIGHSYYFGQGIKKDAPNAALFYTKACDNGNIDGCAQAGSMYENSLDISKASFYHNKACDGGKSFSCISLGGLYENALGVKEDKNKAAELYVKACDDNSWGCLYAGKLYENESWEKNNKSTAIQFYDKSCTDKNGFGCRHAALLYDNKIWEGNDHAKAIQFYKKSCTLGDQEGCDRSVTYEDVWNAYGITSKYDIEKYLKYEFNASEALKLKKDWPSVKPDIAFTLLSLFDIQLAKQIYFNIPGEDMYYSSRIDKAYFEPVIKFAKDYNMPLPDAVSWYKQIEPEHSHTKQLIIDYYKNGFSVFVADDYIKYSTPVEKAKQSEKLAQKECGKDWDNVMKSGFINVTGNPYTLENRCLRARKLESISILSKSSALYKYGNTWIKITDPTRAASTYFTGIIKFTKPVKFIKPDGLPTMIPSAKSIATHSWF